LLSRRDYPGSRGKSYSSIVTPPPHRLTPIYSNRYRRTFSVAGKFSVGLGVRSVTSHPGPAVLCAGRVAGRGCVPMALTAHTRRWYGATAMLTLLVCPSVNADASNECPDEPVQCSDGKIMKVSSCSSCALNGNKSNLVGQPCTCTGSYHDCALPSTLCQDADNDSWDKLLLWNLGTQTQGEGGRADLSCWLLDTNGGALSGTGLAIPATLINRRGRTEVVYIDEIVALSWGAHCDLFQLNLKVSSDRGRACQEFEECHLALNYAPPPPSPSPSPAGGSGDPHLHFAHGGRADFRGRDGAHTQPLPFCAPRKRQSSSPPRVPSP